MFLKLLVSVIICPQRSVYSLEMATKPVLSSLAWLVASDAQM